MFIHKDTKDRDSHIKGLQFSFLKIGGHCNLEQSEFHFMIWFIPIYKEFLSYVNLSLLL